MLSCAVLHGAERGFDDIVQAISDRLHTRPLHIPFFGLVNVATFVTHPAAVKHIDLAVFENLNLDGHAAREIAEAVPNSDDSRWRPFVQARSWKHGSEETVMVYMTEDRGDCKLLVLTVHPKEATIVEVKLNPEALQGWLREPERSASAELR